MICVCKLCSESEEARARLRFYTSQSHSIETHQETAFTEAVTLRGGIFLSDANTFSWVNSE